MIIGSEIAVKHRKKLIVFILTVFLICFTGSVNASAWKVAPDSIDVAVTTDSVPDGTDFIDILIKIKPDNSDYIKFNQNNSTDKNIDESSDLAVYKDKEGYVSALMHYKYIKTNGLIKKSGTAMSQYIFSEKTCWDFADSFKTIKIAYIDENGKVLLVTNEAHISTFFTHVIQREENYYDIKVNGAKLSVKISSGPPWYLVTWGIILICIVIVLVIIVTVIKSIRRISDKRMQNETIRRLH